MRREYHYGGRTRAARTRADRWRQLRGPRRARLRGGVEVRELACSPESSRAVRRSCRPDLHRDSPRSNANVTLKPRAYRVAAATRTPGNCLRSCSHAARACNCWRVATSAAGSKCLWRLAAPGTHGRNTRGRNRSANFRLRRELGMLTRLRPRHAIGNGRPRIDHPSWDRTDKRKAACTDEREAHGTDKR